MCICCDVTSGLVPKDLAKKIYQDTELRQIYDELREYEVPCIKALAMVKECNFNAKTLAAKTKEQRETLKKKHERKTAIEDAQYDFNA